MAAEELSYRIPPPARPLWLVPVPEPFHPHQSLLEELAIMTEQLPNYKEASKARSDDMESDCTAKPPGDITDDWTDVDPFDAESGGEQDGAGPLDNNPQYGPSTMDEYRRYSYSGTTTPDSMAVEAGSSGEQSNASSTMLVHHPELVSDVLKDVAGWMSPPPPSRCPSMADLQDFCRKLEAELEDSLARGSTTRRSGFENQFK